jgi:hypothetical protein
MWLVDYLHIVECFLFFYEPDDICFKVGDYAVYYDPMCYTSHDMFLLFGYIFRCWVAMELLSEICTAKIPPKGELVETGGICFLGSASILFVILYKGLIGSDTHAGLRK